MIETLQEITLNMHGPRNERACVEAQQSDTGSRKVRIHLQSFDGPYKIPADAKVVLYVRKLDGHKVLNDCEIEDESTVLMTLTTQTVACSGRQTAQLYIFNDEGDIKSQSFCINVPRAAYSDDAVQSVDEFGALQTATAAADKATRECTEATAECLKATEEISTAARSHASAIVVSASGEDIVLADSADAELQGLKLFGRTEQETTTGKNLWNPEWVMSAYFFTDGIIANSTTKMIYIPCEPNTTYTVSKLETTRLSIAYTTVEPGTGTAVYGYITYTGTTSSAGTITTGDDAAYLVAYVYNTNNDTSVTFEEMLASIQIEKGSAATAYEPYTGGIASPSPAYPQGLVSAGDGGQISVQIGDTTEEDVQYLIMETPNGLPGIPVTDSGLANYTDESGQMWCADEVDFERGVYVQRLKSIIVTGDLINQYFSDEGYARVTLNDMYMKYGRLEVKSNRFIFNKSGKDEGTIFAYINDIRLYKACSSLDDTREWFDKNEVRVIYILANPIETSLSEDEIAQYKALHTNYPVTTVLNDAGAGMEVGYQADTKNYIDNRFAELQSAVLSMGGNV